MKKSWLIGTTALLLLSANAWAVDEKSSSPSPHGMEHGDGMSGRDFIPYKDLTLEQAREHAHKHAEKLDKMTPEEWDAHKKKVMERRDKWKAMSPEEREKKKAEWRERRKQHQEGSSVPKSDAPVAAH